MTRPNERRATLVSERSLEMPEEHNLRQLGEIAIRDLKDLFRRYSGTGELYRNRRMLAAAPKSPPGASPGEGITLIPPSKTAEPKVVYQKGHSPSTDVSRKRCGLVATAITVCGAVACSSSAFPGVDDCKERDVAMARFGAAVMALENVTRAKVYEVGFNAGGTQDPNAVADILAAAGLNPAVVQAAINPEGVARAVEAEQAASVAFAAGDQEAAYRAADVMLAVVLDAVEEVEGTEARDAVRPPLAALFDGRNTPSEVAELRAAADSALRAAVYRAGLAVQRPGHEAGRHSNGLKTGADSAMTEALDAAIQAALECVE